MADPAFFGEGEDTPALRLRSRWPAVTLEDLALMLELDLRGGDSAAFKKRLKAALRAAYRLARELEEDDDEPAPKPLRAVRTRILRVQGKKTS